jgi:deoxycytidylate deaminase
VSFGPFLRQDAGEKAPRNLFGEGFPESAADIHPLETCFSRIVLSEYLSLGLIPGRDSSSSSSSSLPMTITSKPSPVGNILNLCHHVALMGNQNGEKHGALLLSASNVPLSIGYNHSYSVKGVVKGKAKKVIHAEVHAMVQISDPKLYEGGSVWVTEVSACQSTYCDAFPCPSCTRVLTKHGIRHAFFSKFDGTIGKWSFKRKHNSKVDDVEGVGGVVIEDQALGIARKAGSFHLLDEGVKDCIKEVLTCDFCLPVGGKVKEKEEAGSCVETIKGGVV